MLSTEKRGGTVLEWVSRAIAGPTQPVPSAMLWYCCLSTHYHLWNTSHLYKCVLCTLQCYLHVYYHNVNCIPYHQNHSSLSHFNILYIIPYTYMYRCEKRPHSCKLQSRYEEHCCNRPKVGPLLVIKLFSQYLLTIDVFATYVSPSSTNRHISCYLHE